VFCDFPKETEEVATKVEFRTDHGQGNEKIRPARRLGYCDGSQLCYKCNIWAVELIPNRYGCAEGREHSEDRCESGGGAAGKLRLPTGNAAQQRCQMPVTKEISAQTA
jgi:hypothetical protein